MRLLQSCQRDNLTFVFYPRGAITFSICKMASREGVASMTNEYDISLATPDDVSGILALQEPNLPANGGTLSVRQPADWFRTAILEKSVVVARRDGKVVGYVLGTPLAANAHIPITQAMLSAYPAPSECYLYGPVCVAESERGLGVALALFEVLQKHMAGRPAMTFVRTDNAPSRRAHQKMGMRELGIFLSEDVPYVALAYTA
jgi:predicted N-acetyltransferase YhbS